MLDQNGHQITESLIFGTQIIYVPQHIGFSNYKDKEQWHYPSGIQPGFVIEPDTSMTSYYCRYWRYDLALKLFVPELRTLANSELTNSRDLMVIDSFSQDLVWKATISIYQAMNKLE